MKKSLANPIFIRLTRSDHPPSLGVTLWLGFGLVLAILALITLAILLGEASVTRRILVGLNVAASILVIVSPVLISVIAANLTAREVGREAFQVLRMTDISRDAIVHGFVLTALYRVRVLLILLVALLPILIVQHVFTTQTAVSQYDCYAFVARIGPPYKFWYEDTEAYLRPPLNRECVSASDVRLVLSALLSLPGMLASWGMSLFAAVVGVDQGLIWRRTSPAVILAPLITLTIWFLFSLIPIVGQVQESLNAISCGPAGCVFLDNWLNPLGFDLIYAAVLLAAGIGTVNGSKKRVWGRATARKQ